MTVQVELMSRRGSAPSICTQINFPLCTIAHTPRLPEHCIEYARLLQWPKENPFGEDVPIDGDDPNHISWIFEKAVQRASEHGIDALGSFFYLSCFFSCSSFTISLPILYMILRIISSRGVEKGWSWKKRKMGAYLWSSVSFFYRYSGSHISSGPGSG